MPAAILGTILSLVTGRPDWIVLIGIFLLMGVALDAGWYSWLLKYQPPWMTFVLALGELGILFVIANVVELDLTAAEAIVFYWVSWGLAISTKIAVLPIFSLTYLESAGEFRRIAWSLPPAQVPLPVVASLEDAAREPGEAVRSASGVHAVPAEKLPSPSGVHAAVAPAPQAARPAPAPVAAPVPTGLHRAARLEVMGEAAQFAPGRKPSPIVGGSAARIVTATVLCYAITAATAAAVAIHLAAR